MTAVIVQLSDLHIPAEGRLFDAIDTEARLASTLESLASSSFDVSALLVTGDVADRGDAASYQRAAPLLEDAAARLSAELICIPGNHDDLSSFERHLLRRRAVGSTTDCVVWIGDLRVIALDSTAADGHHGVLTDAQLVRLADELRMPAGDGTILALHHPPVPSPLAALQDLQLRDPDALDAVIRESDVRVILCGHDHHAASATFAGVPVWIAPSLAYTIDVLGAPDRIQGTAHGAITIVEIHSDTVLTTQVPVPDTTAGYVVDEALGTMLDAYS